MTPAIETEANEFAAEFLMPEEVIRPQLRNLSIGVLLDLKREWGVSIQSLIERADGLHLVTAAKRAALQKRGLSTAEISRLAGWAAPEHNAVFVNRNRTLHALPQPQ